MQRQVGLSLGIGLVGLVWLAGCATPATQEQMGTVIGGALGGILGSQVGSGRGQTAAIVAGTLAGAFIGSSVGRSMDQVDQQRIQSTLETAPDRQTVVWRNPNTGHTYQATPIRTFQVSGQDCREYRVFGEIDGSAETITGIACRDAQGRWVNQ